MKLGEFRKVTEGMSDDVEIKVRIDVGDSWVHPCANYPVTGIHIEECGNTKTGVTLKHDQEEFVLNL